MLSRHSAVSRDGDKGALSALFKHSEEVMKLESWIMV